MREPDRNLPWPIDYEAVRLIARAEGCRLQAYRCPAGVWTIGWGETEGVTPDMKWTEAQADKRFCDSLGSVANAVRAMCTVQPTAQQLGALTSLGYNIGLAALRSSTVMKQHNANNHDAASRAFSLWNKARVGGVLTVLPGLTARRAAESALYLTEAEPDRMPQAVAGEAPMRASPITQAGAVTVASGGLVGVSALADQAVPLAGQLKAVAEAMGVNPPVVLAVLLVGTGLASMYWRWRQRQEGWA